VLVAVEEGRREAVLLDPGRVEAGLAGVLAVHVQGEPGRQLQQFVPGQAFLGVGQGQARLVEEVDVEEKRHRPGVEGNGDPPAVVDHGDPHLFDVLVGVEVPPEIGLQVLDDALLPAQAPGAQAGVEVDVGWVAGGDP